MTIVPLLLCYLDYRHVPDSYWLRYYIVAGYVVMYGFVLLTGHTNLVFVYILPMLSVVILYHDGRLIIGMGTATMILNILYIIRDYADDKITMLNSRDYEIQIALLTLCFMGCYLASVLYDRIAAMNLEKQQEVLRLQEERIILEERNKFAYVDGLTELGNRRKFQEYMDELENSEPETVHVAVLDVNNLKNVNDTLGHLAGDELITGAANCIKTSFDKTDECFRFGGDEFLVISTGSAAAFHRNVARLHDTVSLWKGIYIRQLSLAVGCASMDERPGISVEGLVKMADNRMYEDKKKFYEREKYERVS